MNSSETEKGRMERDMFHFTPGLQLHTYFSHSLRAILSLISVEKLGTQQNIAKGNNKGFFSVLEMGKITPHFVSGGWKWDRGKNGKKNDQNDFRVEGGDRMSGLG